MPRSLDPTQKSVGRGMALGAVLSALVLGLGYAFVPPPDVGQFPNFVARLRYTLEAEVFVFLWLAVAIGRVAGMRFFSPSDIDGSGLTAASATLRVPAAILQNTFEQCVLAAGAHLALAATLRGRDMVLIPLLVALFCIGRAFFWVGYARGASGRAFGFATTFYPTLFAWLLAAVLVLIG